MRLQEMLAKLGIDPAELSTGILRVHSPIDGQLMGRITPHTAEQASQIIKNAQIAFQTCRQLPAPKRGELIQLFGQELKNSKEILGRLITMETGKILEEGRGEVQEMIDICDFATGLSRQLYGLTIASERPGHRMMETWHPLGIVGVISAFNFPAAVWAWNFALAIVCGNSVVWKPSEKTPLTALACQRLWERTIKKFQPQILHLSQLLIGDAKVGEILVDHPQVALVSATGSTRMGKAIAPKVAGRFGRLLLELGGNNGMILTSSADLNLAMRAILFSAVGTAGQRCTSLRRLIVDQAMMPTVLSKLKSLYQQIPVGNPVTDKVLVGPMIDQQAFQGMQRALEQAKKDGGKVWGGERLYEKEYPQAYYVKPALVEMLKQTDIVRHETFAPILYILPYQNFDDAIAIHNDVPQGLSSCIFTNDIRQAERFLSAQGSDCGIANVNIGPSGAEIGGAFGGEKETGGGRESGSDSWRNYMRRATNTINYSNDLPLAQGIQFNLA